MQNQFSPSLRVAKVLSVSALQVQVQSLFWDFKANSINKKKLNTSKTQWHSINIPIPKVPNRGLEKMRKKQVQIPSRHTLSPVISYPLSGIISDKMWIPKNFGGTKVELQWNYHGNYNFHRFSLWPVLLTPYVFLQWSTLVASPTLAVSRSFDQPSPVPRWPQQLTALAAPPWHLDNLCNLWEHQGFLPPPAVPQWTNRNLNDLLPPPKVLGRPARVCQVLSKAKDLGGSSGAFANPPPPGGCWQTGKSMAESFFHAENSR